MNRNLPVAGHASLDVTADDLERLAEHLALNKTFGLVHRDYPNTSCKMDDKVMALVDSLWFWQRWRLSRLVRARMIRDVGEWT